VTYRYPGPAGPGVLFVSDSGNDAIRTVAPDTGAVGTVPGLPVRNPQGLGLLANGELVVADRGRGVVLVLDAAGPPRVLAGEPYQFGTQDGTGAGARFHALKGLSVDRATGVIYVLDGHALRSITGEGVVHTLLGSVLEAGCAGPASTHRWSCPPWG
jgi:hypothetical protein